MAIESQFCSENVGFPLYGSLDWMVESEYGRGFSLNHPILQNQRQWNQSQSSETSLKTSQVIVLNQNRNPFMDVSFSIAAQVEKQNQEMDRHIRLQNQRLKLAVQEEMKQRLEIMVTKMESKTMVLLRQKDEEIAQALRRTMDLEQVLKKLEAEKQIRQREARENEAMVLALKNTLQQTKDRASNPFMDGASDAESCCDSNREESERRERINGEEARDLGMATAMGCRVCHFRASSVLCLPCRHLCLCKFCESAVEFCPVCHCANKATIQALI